MTQPAPLPSFLRATPAPAQAGRPRLLDQPAVAPAQAMAADVYRPAAVQGGYPGYPQPAHPQGAYPQPAYPQPGYGQPQPALVPIYAPTGQIVGYAAAAPAPPPPVAKPASADQRTGQAALTTVTAGLGVAGIFAPPVLPFAGAIGLVQALDTQIGNPVSKSVGFVVNGVVDGATAVGKFFGNLFGGKD